MPRRAAPGIVHIDIFLHLFHQRLMAPSPLLFDLSRGDGYPRISFNRAMRSLRLHNYIETRRIGRAFINTINPDLVAIDGSDLVFRPPGRRGLPDLDLLLFVLSGGSAPRSSFMRLWSGAADPSKLYREARSSLLMYGYIEDRYRDWHYYPGPRALKLIGHGRLARLSLVDHPGR